MGLAIKNWKILQKFEPCIYTRMGEWYTYLKLFAKCKPTPCRYNHLVQNALRNSHQGIKAETCFIEADEYKYAHQDLTKHV